MDKRCGATSSIEKAERAVLRAAVGCIDKRGFAYSIATESITRTYFINEAAYGRLEAAVAKLKEARRAKKRRKS